jgi:hypothetical protein
VKQAANEMGGSIGDAAIKTSAFAGWGKLGDFYYIIFRISPRYWIQGGITSNNSKHHEIQLPLVLWQVMGYGWRPLVSA